ncbi:MAG: DUF1638 domain-containing protein [Firmicutes bacterium]|nr:DUF1638 domain-containing protein [Bacillota bacterium]
MKRGRILNTVALACETIIDEINRSAAEINSKIPIRWIESGLHNSPERLRNHLQDEITTLESDDLDYILLLFGYCGNALLGLVSAKCRLVIPRVDDCISLILGGNNKRNELSKKEMAYYLTKGWLRHDKNLWNEYHYCLRKYGQQRTHEIYRIMLGNYKNLNVIATGAYNLADILPQTKELAGALGLEHKVIDGSLDIIRKALLAEWDDDFAIIEAGDPVSLETLRLLPPSLPQTGSSG